MPAGQHFEASETALPINADGQRASRRNAGDLAMPNISRVLDLLIGKQLLRIC
jgi:hypothetical protein